jgi:asparagine synthase (glutamine-hydrolysing)
MCGIVGILARNGVVDPEVLERATQSLAHRGPDDHGTVILRDNVPEPVEIGLGNRRLAILDLSPLGHQPMHDPATGNWIVHNGEIYNFREVREKLEKEGISFVSQSDTEVALKAYGQWGERCLDEFRGMFAFAIWDARRHRLFVARDPMGIKPLYYFQSAEHFLFASEIRTLLGTGLVPRRIDPAGLFGYLAFGSVYEPATMVEGISALAPGSYLLWEKGRVQEARYWDLTAATEMPKDRTSLIAETEERLDQSVQMQLVSDVPVGVFLSGGIDSSSLVGILSRHRIRPRTFSIVFKEEEFSEAKYSRAIAERFKTDHHEIPVSQQDFFAAIPAALRAMDQPTIDGVNTYFVSEQARRAGVKVALSGLGGDELFAGYSSFRAVPRMERFAGAWRHAPGPVRAGVAGMFQVLAPASDQNRKLSALLRENGRLLHPYFLSRMLFTPGVRDGLSRTANVEISARVQRPLQDSLARTRKYDPINRVSYLESRCYMLNTLLRDSDAMSMAHGLEVRVPLIDHRLAESLMRMPGTWKMDATTPKPLLVGALRGALPEEIVRRPKTGFTLPFDRWVRESLRPEIEKALGTMGESPLAEVLTDDGSHRVWNEFLRGTTSWSRPWSLFVLRRWCEVNL